MTTESHNLEPLTPADADYLKIILSDMKEIDPSYLGENGLPAEIAYYCRECKKVIEKPERIPQTLRFKCRECGGERVAFGTQNSVQSYFRLKGGVQRGEMEK